MRNDSVKNVSTSDLAIGFGVKSTEQSKANVKGEVKTEGLPTGVKSFTEEVKKLMAQNVANEAESAAVSSGKPIVDVNAKTVADGSIVGDAAWCVPCEGSAVAQVKEEITGVGTVTVYNSDDIPTVYPIGPLDDALMTDRYLVAILQVISEYGIEGGAINPADTLMAASTPEEKLRAGNELITYALNKIASILGISEEGAEASAFEFDVTHIDQLAAIMSYLGLTVKMANDRIDVGANAETANKLMKEFGMASPIADIAAPEDPAELSEFATALRTEKFHLEMAFKLIGVYEIIARKAAEMNRENTVTGIPQAVNPANLSMSTADTVSAFSSLITEELAGAVERVRQIVRGQAEMTGIEKAAISLGAVRSEILKAAMGKSDPVDTMKFEGVSVESLKALKGLVDAEVLSDIGANVKKGVNTNVLTGILGDIDTDVEADASKGAKAGVNTNARVDINTAVKVDDDAGVDTVVKPVGVDTVRKIDVKNINHKDNANTNVNPAAKQDSSANVSGGAKTDVNATTNVGALRATPGAQADVFTGVKAGAKDDVNVDTAKASAKVDTARSVKDGVSEDTDTNVEVKPRAKAEKHTDVKISIKDDITKTSTKVNTANTARSVRDGVNVDIDTNAEIKPSAKAKAEKHTDVKISVKDDVTVDTKASAKVNTARVDVKADVNVNAAASASVDTDDDAAISKVRANIITQKAAAAAELPVSARESAGDKTLESAIAANRRAFLSTEHAAFAARASSSGAAAELPVSFAESVSKVVDKGVNTANTVNTANNVNTANTADNAVNTAVGADLGVRPSPAGVDNAASAVNTVNTVNTINTEESVQARAARKANKAPATGSAAEVPVSALESATKKSAVKKGIDNGINKDGSGSVNKADSSVKPAKAAVLTSGSASTGTPEVAVAVSTQSDLTAGLKQAAVDNQPTKPVSSNKYAKAEASTDASSGKPAVLSTLAAGMESEASISESGDEVEQPAGVDRTDASAAKDASAPKHVEKTASTLAQQLERLEVIRQITERIDGAVRNGAHEIRMTLRPEALGEVRMSLRVEGDVVYARMMVENRQVKAIVEGGLQSLKESLEKQNLEFGGVSVDVGTDSDSNRPTKQVWQELAEKSGSKVFKEGVGGMDGDDGESGSVDNAPGSDTGRRFGSNTFEYFV